MSTDLTILDTNSYFTPANFEHFYRIANMMSKSQMVPKNYINKPQDVLIAMEYGRSLGLGPLQAIQNIAVINGKPCLYGDCVLAVCSGRQDFENIEEQPILDNAGVIVGYKCTVKRRGRSLSSHTFTIEDAKKAKLWGKAGPWSEYPNRMLQMRARAFTLRDSFADALGGVRIAEEVQDYREIRDVTPQNQASEILEKVINKNVEQEPIEVVMDPKVQEFLEDLE